MTMDGLAAVLLGVAAVLAVVAACTVGVLELERWLGRRRPKIRPYHGKCPGCGASERRWCYPDCQYTDTLSGQASTVQRSLRYARRPDPLPIHRTEAGYPVCSTCEGGGCPDCTDHA